MKNYKDEYTIIETSKLTGIKIRTIREWIKVKKIKAYKHDGSRVWYISKEEIERMLKKVLT